MTASSVLEAPPVIPTPKPKAQTDIRTEFGGTVEFSRVVPGFNVYEEAVKFADAATRTPVTLNKLVVADFERLIPQPSILVRHRDGKITAYPLPKGAAIMVKDGDVVPAGHVLALLRREITFSMTATPVAAAVVAPVAPIAPVAPVVAVSNFFGHDVAACFSKVKKSFKDYLIPTRLETVKSLFPGREISTIVDTDAPILLDVTLEDCQKGEPMNPRNCAGARAAKRVFDDAFIGGATSYLVTGTTAIRARNGEDLRTEIRAFDREAVEGPRKTFRPGTYHLGQFSPSDSIGYKKPKKTKNVSVADVLAAAAGTRTAEILDRPRTKRAPLPKTHLHEARLRVC